MTGHARLMLVVFIATVGVLLNACSKQEASKEFKDCSDCPTMVIVPAGRFLMGSPADEEGRKPREDQQHEVIISKAFAVGKFEVTFEEWDTCVAGGGCNGYHPDDDGYGRGDHPVVNVSWDDAKAYLLWLSEISGKPYRLLSEAEWEYAAKAGTTTPFSFGKTITSDQANYNGKISYADGPVSEPRDKPLPVGSFPPNSFRLYDMHGNAYEWTEDCYNEFYFEDAPTDGSAWLTGRCSRRIKRGGCWYATPLVLRSSSRLNGGVDYRNICAGFRVARALD